VVLARSLGEQGQRGSRSSTGVHSHGLFVLCMPKVYTGKADRRVEGFVDASD
jgi:hypothetical protein